MTSFSTRSACVLLVGVLAFCAIPGVFGQAPPPMDLGQANLEDLMEIKVTSVSKREQKLSRTAAAIFVITQEDIRRSGAINIPDLLRMAPGVDVEQISASKWAIGIRGFNSGISNKVLVIIDGRTVYTPLFSGVYWDAIDMPLEDIERIEIIRGPGATVWGANAVNGVISIITKQSKNTPGGLAIVSAGSQVRTSDTMQYGGSAGAGGTYRAFAKGSDIGNSASPTAGAADDRWSNVHGGFRSDWTISPDDSLTVQGGLLGVREKETRYTDLIHFAGPLHESANQYGGDLSAQWNHTLQGGSETSLLAYYSTSHRTDYGSPDKVTTFNLDFQQHAMLGDRHEIVWGLGYRSDNMNLSTSGNTSVLPAAKVTNLFSTFFQDEVQISDSVWFTLGAKFEHNSYTGFQVEPGARLVWSPGGGRHTVWASAAKSLRQPSLKDAAIQVNLLTTPVQNDTVTIFRVVGNPLIKDEELRDYELGYRGQLSRKFSYDTSAFLSFYKDLETSGPAPFPPTFVPGSPAQVIVPILIASHARAVDYGGEVSLGWAASTRWRISPGYSYLHASLRTDPSYAGNVSSNIATDFPRNMFQVRSKFDLGHQVEFDQSIYYTARLPGGKIPGHARLDLRVARKLGESTEISLTGQNLLRNRTLEYGDSFGLLGTQSVRSVYASVQWHFAMMRGR